MSTSHVVLFGGGSSGSTPPPRRTRTGLVHQEGHCVADDGGPFNALGLTFFWAPWGYEFDRARLETNLAAIADDAQADYIRVLGAVGPEGWRDRTIDPSWDDYDDVIGSLTDLAYDRYGLRVQWSINGGGSVTPRDQRAFLDRFVRMSLGREHKIFAFEIANEGQGYNDDLVFLRAAADYLRARVPNLVAITTHNGANACELYANYLGAMTVHYQRDFGGDDLVTNGVLYHPRPWRQPWGTPGEYDAACTGRLPKLTFNNEPIGPRSSGNMDDNPLSMAVAFGTTFIAQNGAYVLHCGPGIRGGGYEDVNQEPGKVKPYVPREANFRDQPNWKPICRALRIARDVLPPGLANWTRANSQWSTCPFRGFDKADEAGLVTQVYHTFNGPDTWSVAHGIRAEFTASPVQAMELEWLDAETFEVFKSSRLGAGQPFTVTSDRPAVFLRGRVL